MAAWDGALPDGTTCLVQAGTGWVVGVIPSRCPMGEVGEQVRCFPGISPVMESGVHTG